MSNDEDRPWRTYHLTLTVVLVIVVVLDCAIIGYRLGAHREISLADGNVKDYTFQLDPNTASADALSQLPCLDVRQAREIVEYRQSHRSSGRTGPCYRTLKDLDDVPWIGPKTLEKIGEYMLLPPDDQTTSRPTEDTGGKSNVPGRDDPSHPSDGTGR